MVSGGEEHLVPRERHAGRAGLLSAVAAACEVHHLWQPLPTCTHAPSLAGLMQALHDPRALAGHSAVQRQGHTGHAG